MANTHELKRSTARGSLQRMVRPLSRDIHFCSVKDRMTGQGLPAANTSAGIARVTTLPAPITDRSPMVMPGQMMAPPPTQTSEPIETGLANSTNVRRSGALIG
jgi:hypothetical protein